MYRSLNNQGEVFILIHSRKQRHYTWRFLAKSSSIPNDMTEYCLFQFCITVVAILWPFFFFFFEHTILALFIASLTCLTAISRKSRRTVTRETVDTIYTQSTIYTCVINTVVYVLNKKIENKKWMKCLVTNFLSSLLLEIRDSQNLAKLGLGGKPSLHVL